jgi:hypothetical protein
MRLQTGTAGYHLRRAAYHIVSRRFLREGQRGLPEGHLPR